MGMGHSKQLKCCGYRKAQDDDQSVSGCGRLASIQAVRGFEALPLSWQTGSRSCL